MVDRSGTPCNDPRNCGKHHCGCNRHIPLNQGECKICRP